MMSQTTSRKVTKRSVSSQQRAKMIGIPRLLKRVLLFMLSLTWILASWGDYVFQAETQGMFPTLWVVAPGLKDPSIHAGVQLRTQKEIFVGGLCRSLLGFAIGVFYAIFNCRRRFTRQQQHTASLSSKEQKIPSHSNYQQQGPKRLVLWNIILCIVLYSFGAWAPMTNLFVCMLGAILLTPPGGGGTIESTQTVSSRNISLPGTSLQKQERAQALPNVILMVHESLSGAALKSKRGKEAAPFYHELVETDSDMYHFRKARTVAGTTPIATPGLLTGLLPYSDQGVSLVKAASLARDFRKLGYETASFVSYGSDWSGSSWAILSDLLRPYFDTIVDPKVTGDPLVNEYGMDDRLMIPHIRKWLLRNSTRPNASSNSTSKNDSSNDIRQKPFFAVVVMNNNHFPHLMHDTYTGEVECENDNNENKTKAKPSTSTPKAVDGGELDSWGYSQGMDDDYYGYGCDSFDGASRYFSSIRTFDEALKGIFRTLNETSTLKNTILAGAGDHGDTPPVLTRMNDVTAPILDIPLWMHIPKQFLRHRDFCNTGISTCLVKNLNRTVSILDIVPTIRDLVGFSELYSVEEQANCVLGTSLLRPILDDRALMSWQGLPLQNHQIGIFSTGDESLVYYAKDPGKSKHIDYIYHENDIFLNLSEYKLVNQPELRLRWKSRLERHGLFDHELVRRWMPDLINLLSNSNSTVD